MSASVEPLGRVPALDGVRAVSVLLVLLFHARVSWMPGGYVGVSVFFTLSGFLITSVLLAERSASGRVDIPRFYARRARRLLPASLVCLALTVVLDRAGLLGLTRGVRRDVLAALGQVANWNYLAGDTSYAAMVEATIGRIGPVDHFWSLAIEEQFYWLWPVLAWAVLRRRFDLRRWTLVVGLLVGATTASAFLIAARWGAEAAYWATPARAAEILTGALAASVLATGDRRRRVAASPAAGLAGLGGLAVIVGVAVSWPASGSPVDDGWLSVVSWASVAVLVGALSRGPFARLLALRPVEWLGGISYGVYLYHWPLFAVLDADRVGVDGGALLVVRFAATLAVAAASSRWIEDRIRRGARALSWRPRAVALSAVASVVAVAAVAIVVIPADVSGSEFDAVPATFAPTTGEGEPEVVTSTSTSVGAPDTTEGRDLGSVPTTPVPTVPPGPPEGRVLLIGDSTAVTLAEAFLQWSEALDGVEFASLASVGCGVVQDAVALGTDPAAADEILARCGAIVDEKLPSILATSLPDVVVVMVTLPDAVERTWTDEEGALSPSDPRFLARMTVDYEHLADLLVGAGVGRVVWVVPARPTDQFLRNVINPIEDADWETFVGVVRSMADRHPDVIELLDFEAWCAENDPEASLRPDGLHVARDRATIAVEGAFVPRLVELLAT